MRGPQPPAVTLTAEEQQALEALIRGHRTAQQLVLRARIILAAADGRNNSQIARRLERRSSSHAASATSRHCRCRTCRLCTTAPRRRSNRFLRAPQ